MKAIKGSYLATAVFLTQPTWPLSNRTFMPCLEGIFRRRDNPVLTKSKTNMSQV